MRKVITLYLVLVAFLFVYQIGCPKKQDVTSTKQEKTPLTDAELMARYQDIITRLNLTTKIEGCLRSTSKIILLEEEYKPNRDAKVRKITGPIDMLFDAYTGKLYSIRNDVISEKIHHRSKDWYNKKPTKTADEIKEICKDILQKLGLQKTLVLDRCEFISEGWAAGRWYIKYLRIHNGYQYREDGVKISFIEEYGLLSYSNFCTSNTCSTDVKVSKEDAQKIALEFAQKLIFSKQTNPATGSSFSKWFKGFKIGDVLSQELLIVNPNYLLTNKSTYGTFKRDRNARLAWFVTVEAKYMGKIGPGGERLPDKKIFIWIDAATGEMLGGDSTL